MANLKKSLNDFKQDKVHQTSDERLYETKNIGRANLQTQEAKRSTLAKMKKKYGGVESCETRNVGVDTSYKTIEPK